jgi:hypothetical protein
VKRCSCSHRLLPGRLVELTAASALYVGIDQYRNNPEPVVIDVAP